MTNPTEEAERRVKHGCVWVFVLLATTSAVMWAQFGTTLFTVVLLVLTLLTLGMIVVVNLPQGKR
jgi:hypothetical protein